MWTSHHSRMISYTRRMRAAVKYRTHKASRESYAFRGSIQRIAGHADSITPLKSANHSRILIMNRTACAIGLIAALANPLSAQSKPVDWDAIARESQTILADYLRI